MSQEILDVDTLFSEQLAETGKLNQTIEQEAANIAEEKARRIFSILRKEFIQSSLGAKKDEKIDIVTGVKTDIALSDAHNNEGCAKSLIKNLTCSLESKGYIVSVNAKISEILLYKSVPVEVSLPEEKLAPLGIGKNIKRISPSELNDDEKVVRLHSSKKSVSALPEQKAAQG